MKKRKPTHKELISVYEKKGCNVTATCQALGINRTTFYNWRKRSERLDAMLEEVEESIIDYAESKLVEHIQDGDTTCLIFFLKTKGKKRGYIERVEQDVTVNPFLELMQVATSDGE